MFMCRGVCKCAHKVQDDKDRNDENNGHCKGYSNGPPWDLLRGWRRRFNLHLHNHLHIIECWHVINMNLWSPQGTPFSTKCQLEVSYNVIPKHYITMAKHAHFDLPPPPLMPGSNAYPSNHSEVGELSWGKLPSIPATCALHSPESTSGSCTYLCKSDDHANHAMQSRSQGWPSTPTHPAGDSRCAGYYCCLPPPHSHQ